MCARALYAPAHLKAILEEQIASKRARFERLLGADLAAVESALDDAIATDPRGKTLGGRSKADPGLKRGEVMRLVTEVARAKGTPELDAMARVSACDTGRGGSASSLTNPRFTFFRGFSLGVTFCDVNVLHGVRIRRDA